MKSRCIDLLIAEHKIILRAVGTLSAMAGAAAGGNALDSEDVKGILEILRTFADEFHQAKEEKGLFPVFTARCDQSEIAAVRHMLCEHEQDRSLIEGIDDALRRSDPADFVRSAGRLASILRTHIYKEDNILFDIVDKSLSAEDDHRVLKAFEAFDRDFVNGGLDKLMHRLRMLEWKYLRKAAA